MLLKVLSVASLAAICSVSVAQAQGRAPAEMPPPGFAGQQYVDSRGCVFIRAGHGGQVNWVARIDGTRKPICGQTPSAVKMNAARRELAAPSPAPAPPAPAVVAAAPAPAAPAPAPAPRAARSSVPVASYVPPPVTYGAPSPLRPQPQAPRPVVAAPAPVAPAAPAPVAAAPAAPISRTAGCPDYAPVGQVYPLHRGGSLLVCASGPHRLTGLRPGDVERMAQIPPAPSTGYHAAPWGKAKPARVAEADLMTPPPGYKPAWRDDRLNPNRARGTAQGDQQMRQIWTDKVPQQLTHPAHAQPRKAAVSSKAMPVAQGASGARFVQVGSFGVPENAARAAQRLQALGLPVQVSRGAIKGKPVQVVKAGPFTAPGQAEAALRAARSAGFGDAILRR
jgi:hypothetical protein